MAKTLRDLVDEAVGHALSDGSMSLYGELLRQQAMFDVLDEYEARDSADFRVWLEQQAGIRE